MPATNGDNREQKENAKDNAKIEVTHSYRLDTIDFKRELLPAGLVPTGSDFYTRDGFLVALFQVSVHFVVVVPEIRDIEMCHRNSHATAP